VRLRDFSFSITIRRSLFSYQHRFSLLTLFWGMDLSKSEEPCVGRLNALFKDSKFICFFLGVKASYATHFSSGIRDMIRACLCYVWKQKVIS